MKIEHIALFVSDLEGAREFFEKYFDGSSNEKYTSKNKPFQSYFITFEDGARLELMYSPETEERTDNCDFTGLHHLAFSLGSEEKVDELTARFRNDGYAVISGPRVTGDGYYESCISGFEGNVIELTV